MQRSLHICVALAAGVAGASAMVLEVAGAHALAPGFGTGMNAWAAMITVALGGLMCGYALGGLAADRWKAKLARTVLPSLLASGGLLFAVDALVWHGLVAGLAAVGPRLGALLAASALFLIPFVLLGAVLPAAVKLWTRTVEEVGWRSGLVSAISAAGSLAGASAAGFVLVPALPLETVFGAFAAALLVTAGAVFFLAGGSKAAGTGAVVLACLAVFVPRRPLESGVVYRGASLFGPVEIIDRGEARFLVVSGTIQGAMIKGRNESLFPYVQTLGEMLRRSLPHERPKVLIVGLGGGLLPRTMDAGVCEAVEVDPAMVATAVRFFSFDRSKFPVHVADGRAFLGSGTSLYHAIIFDAYGGGNHPYHLLTRESFRVAKRRLNPGGILAVNFLGYVEGPEGRLVRAVEATLRAVFEELEIFSSEASRGYANVIFVAREVGAPVCWPGGTYERRASFLVGTPPRILTDSRNPVALWSATVAERWREESRRMLSR